MQAFNREYKRFIKGGFKVLTEWSRRYMERLSALPFTPSTKQPVTSKYFILPGCQLVQLLEENEMFVRLRRFQVSDPMFLEPISSKLISVFKSSNVNFVDTVVLIDPYNELHKVPAIVLKKNQNDPSLYVVPFHHQIIIDE